jgi:hypothetical protein
MSVFREGFDRTHTRNRLLERLLSHNRGLAVTGQVKRSTVDPDEIGGKVLSMQDLSASVGPSATTAEVVKANLAHQS